MSTVVFSLAVIVMYIFAVCQLALRFRNSLNPARNLERETHNTDYLHLRRYTTNRKYRRFYQSAEQEGWSHRESKQYALNMTQR